MALSKFSVSPRPTAAATRANSFQWSFEYRLVGPTLPVPTGQFSVMRPDSRSDRQGHGMTCPADELQRGHLVTQTRVAQIFAAGLAGPL
jgi:hypothetical protein